MEAAATDSRQPNKPGGPFGQIFQHELGYMTIVEIPANDRWLLTVLRTRFDPRTGTVTDRVETLARWSGLAVRSTERSLSSLKRYGLIERKPVHARGSKGWTWTTTLIPYQDWPTEPLERRIATTTAYVRVFFPPHVPANVAGTTSGEHADMAAISREYPPNRGVVPAKSGPNARQPVPHNPDVPPDIYPDDDDVVLSETRTGPRTTEIREALAVLGRTSWYAVDGKRDHAVLAGADPEVDLVAEVRAFVEYAKANGKPDHPRGALQGWLKTAAERQREAAPVPELNEHEVFELEMRIDDMLRDDRPEMVEAIWALCREEAVDWRDDCEDDKDPGVCVAAHVSPLVHEAYQRNKGDRTIRLRYYADQAIEEQASADREKRAARAPKTYEELVAIKASGRAL